MQEINTEKLNWNPKTKTLSGELSETIDMVFEPFVDVISHHTGSLKIFELINTHRDSDGDITHYTFEARATPEIKLVLFND